MASRVIADILIKPVNFSLAVPMSRLSFVKPLLRFISVSIISACRDDLFFSHYYYIIFVLYIHNIRTPVRLLYDDDNDHNDDNNDTFYSTSPDDERVSRSTCLRG